MTPLQQSTRGNEVPEVVAGPRVYAPALQFGRDIVPLSPRMMFVLSAVGLR
jgi:hypothetical protein